MTVVRVALLASGLFVTTGSVPSAPPRGIEVPTGFTVTEFAGPDLANDIYTLHISRDGRILVAGRGYARELIDADSDGRADRTVELVAGLREGPMGVMLEGDDLYLVVDGGLKRYRLKPGVPTAAEAAESVLAVKTGGEHDAHAVRRGPDGWLYLLCGNTAGVTAKTVTSPTSPVTKPVAGCLLRISPARKQVEVIADGFRNPYDFDFNAGGDAFTYDSDNERCVGLPWFEPTRFYHIVPGAHHGWLNPQIAQTWRRPPYFWDVVTPVATAGRGSPTGVCCYRHTAFPASYRGGFFLADWTFGRVVFVQPRRSGAGYTGTAEPFARSVGDDGFAPTALAVHPATGDLYVSTGGRGTRGAVYRISPNVREANPPAAPTPTRHELFDELLTAERDGSVVARSRVQELVRAGVRDDDRLVRRAAARLATRLPIDDRRGLLDRAGSDRERVALGFSIVNDAPADARTVALGVIAAASAYPSDRLAAVRLLQVGLGDLTDPAAVGGAFEGYTARRPFEPAVGAAVAAVLRTVFPTGHHDLDRELTRTFAVLADDNPGTLAKVLAAVTGESDPVDDVHAMIVLARLRAVRTPEQTRAMADALLRLDEKAEAKALARDRHWPLRLAEAAAALAKHDPGFAAAVADSPRFGRAGHVAIVRLPGLDRGTAARRFLARASGDPDYGWQADHIALLGELPPAEVGDTLQHLWDRGGLTDALIPLLVRRPAAGDREKFLSALRSSNPGTVGAAAAALRNLPDGGDKELAALLRSFRALPAEATAARKQVVATLRARTGADLGTDERAWGEWVGRARPAVAADLAAGVSGAAEIRKRLSRIDWSAGDPVSGRKVFAKASCAACHNGAQAVGPSLEGVAGRFSRDDLITATIDPNRDVSPRYRVTKISTDDGKVYLGVVIYEANDGLILQSGATETVRVAGPRVEAKRQLDTSLMPAGLLDPLADREIADLFAYLKSFGKPGSPGR